jgi:hypothetical protein
MNKVITFAFWLVSLLFAYWLGLEEKPAVIVNQNEDVHSSSQKKKIGLDENFAVVQNNEQIFASSDQNFSVFESVIQTTDEEKSSRNNFGEELGLISSHPVERLQAFAQLLRVPDNQSVKTALEAYESLPGGPGRFSELKVLAFAWGQVNPQEALAWSEKQEHWDKYIASGSIMDSWAREDSEAAIRWAKENFEGDENHYFVGIINGLSENSLPQATDLMTELPFGRVRGRAAHILFEKVWNQGEDIAMHWAEHLPEGTLQNFAYGELGEKVAQTDMPRAIEWIDSMDESSLKLSVTEKVAKEMAREDPAKTANWINSLPEGKSKIAAMNQLAEMWTRQDPAATAEWINQLPASENTDPLIETLVNKVHKSDPQGALTWAETISNPDRRKHMIEKVEKVLRKQEDSEKKSD